MTLKSLSTFCAALLLGALALKAQTIPSPKDHFGFDIGDDYQLANYTQTEAYFKKLAASPRVKLVDMGLTEEGRHQFMLIVSSPDNIKKLDYYKDISRKLSRAENLTDAEAHKLAESGKAVVWIDGGLHATEVVGAHQLIQTAYDFVTRTDAETMRILDKDIILFVHANPDGQELVSNWYMQEKDVTKRNTSVPRLWEKYIGHDNNRDFYMMNMKETQNVTRQQYLEWAPQIVYNHHQTGPAGSVLSGPPYRDPFNYVFDPLMVTGLDAVGAAMISRLNQEGKPGYTKLSGSEYSTWWNGGLRTATYFHNMVGLLTEIIGSPTPSSIPLVPERLIPSSATPYPVLPQTWHFKQSIDYSVSLNYAVLDYAARTSDEMLYNSYQMGKNSIERGSKDYWTLSPKRVDQINALAAAARSTDTTANAGGRGGRGGAASGAVTLGGGNGFGRGGVAMKYYDTVLKNPALRDPRGYIIPSDQADFATAVKFINTCLRSGLIVNKATSAFTVAGKSYPAGSFVIKTAQAYRPEVLDRFEPQDHPNDFLYPGGPPIRPYDMTGWTLSYQMGVKFDRILDAFDGPFQRIPYGELQPMPSVSGPAVAKGYIVSAKANNSFIAVNDLFQAGAQVFRVPDGGDFYVPYTPKVKTVLDKASTDLGVKSIAAAKPKTLVAVTAARIALWDTYGGSMPSGWTRWLMEQYHFPFKVVYPQEFDAGNLKDKYDAIIFVGGAIPSPARAGGRGGAGGGFGGRGGGNIPAEFSTWTGSITAEKTIPQLKAFLEAGGTIITVGSSANLAYQLNLPVHNALVDMVGGQEKPYSGDKFYVPGAVLRVTLDTKQPATWGMSNEADVLYDNSPAFKLDADAASKGVKPLMWFATDKPLRSGWAFGQKYLKDDVEAFQASIGKGNLYVFGPEITFRGQSHGTFKLLFNQLYTTTPAN